MKYASHKKTKNVRPHLNKVSRGIKPRETESRTVVAMGWGSGGELSFKGYRVSDLQDSLWMEGGDGCTTVQMYLTLLSCVLKNGKK